MKTINNLLDFLHYKILYAFAKKTRVILFYPEKPKLYHILFKICHLNGWRIVTKGDNVDSVIRFQDTTFGKTFPQLLRFKNVINFKCTDISKNYTEKIFKKVFGYSLFINPQTYTKPYVKKSNTNSAHDGEIVQKPSKQIKGFVYQKVINNQEGEYVCDIRVPIFIDTIPFVYLKYRPLESRFNNTNSYAKMQKAEEAFSREEITKIIQFTRCIGLDYGELDVLRNKDDEKIYIVDVNNTPAGPPNHISKYEYQLALQLLSEEFERVFLYGK